jgi:hypothetical protein
MLIRLSAALTLVVGLIAGPTLANDDPKPQVASIPMLEFPLKNGASRDDVYKMSEHKNGVFVFEAYRLSCGYCNENAPAVDRLATDYASNPRVQVLDLSLDVADADFAEWINLHKPNHPVIQDTGRRVYNALKQSNGVPQVFVVNCKGLLVGGHVGTWGGAESAIRGLIDRALQTTCE